jgi:hypothetical protein
MHVPKKYSTQYTMDYKYFQLSSNLHSNLLQLVWANICQSYRILHGVYTNLVCLLIQFQITANSHKNARIRMNNIPRTYY